VLDRPGVDRIQFSMLGDYHNNLTLYPEFHAYFKQSQVPLLAVWGKGDPIFVPAGAEAFRNDLPDAEVHLRDAGHFALESQLDVISDHMLRFLARSR
jgi:pimeloyl-ACP methyl ester carboxylesterase